MEIEKKIINTCIVCKSMVKLFRIVSLEAIHVERTETCKETLHQEK